MDESFFGLLYANLVYAFYLQKETLEKLPVWPNSHIDELTAFGS
jgi:hypothetical protein